MKTPFTEETKMLNYHSADIQELICRREWNRLSEYDKISEIYKFVQNEILFGYNRSDLLTAEQVLSDGYGQCNTKATLLMALLRAVDIPCRLHGFEVSKCFQLGATNRLISFLAPSRIIHTWAEVLYQGQWLALEGVITDIYYFEAVKAKYKNIKKDFKRYAIATENFETLSIEWHGNHTYVQSAAIITDFGIYTDPDAFFREHNQHLSKVKNFMYVHLGRKIMNNNVAKMRNSFRSMD